MIEKLNLVSNIEKYHLGGVVESVKWVISNNKMHVNFVSPNQDLVGSVSCNMELEDGTIGIFNTSALVKMINILDKDIIVNIEKQFQAPIKLLIEDTNFSLQYSLADPFIIQTAPTINEPSYDVSFNIDAEFIQRFSKAKSALGANVKDVFRISCAESKKGGKEIKMVLGEPTSHSNKIEFSTLAEFETLPTKALSFNSAYVKEILNANKGETVGAKGFLSVEGMLKLEFSTETEGSTYYLPELQL